MERHCRLQIDRRGVGLLCCVGNCDSSRFLQLKKLDLALIDLALIDRVDEYAQSFLQLQTMNNFPQFMKIIDC